ncbi:retrovirus-related pol polyprotein from transposon TNT 1-94 [Tanacetum coccineum]
MAAVNDVPQLVDKKGGMEPYYLKCIKDGPFQPKTAEDHIMVFVISCVLAKETWTDLVHNFEGPSDTKENRIMDLKLEYQPFRENLPEKWLTFSQGLRNANHTQTLDLTDIYGRISQRKSEMQNYKAEYKKMKAKLALLETSPSSSQNPKTFQPKNKGLVTETFDWDEEEVSDKVEVTQVQVNTLLSMDEDADWQNYLKYIYIDLKFIEEQRLNLLSKYNKMVFELNKCRDELLILKQAKLDASCIRRANPHQKKKVLGGELLTESSSKMNENENLFIPSSMRYDQEMVPKTKDWVERLNPDQKLQNFNTRRILVPKSQAVNESLETLNTPESSKDSEAEFLTPLPPLKSLQGASSSSEDSSNESVSGTVTISESKQTTSLVPTEVKDTEQELKLNELTKLVQMLIDEKHILRTKAKPFPPCTHCGFNDHIPDDCRNYPECGICGSYDHSTPGHNRLFKLRRKYKLILLSPNDPHWRKFRNHKLKNLCDKKGISQNFSSPYTPEQNGVAERKNKNLIKAARTILNGSLLSKHFWTDAVRIACYTQNRSIIVKRHDKTSYEIFRERIPNINYFHVFRCPVFIHNHKDNLGKFDAKADDGYFLGYSSVSKAFRYNTRRQQIEETYHVTFDESMEAIRFTNTSVDDIGIDDSSNILLNEVLKKTHLEKSIDFRLVAPNKPEIPYAEDTEGNNTEVSESIIEPLVPDVTQSHITNQASTSMLTRSMVAKLTVASDSECLFVDFLSEIEPKKVLEALKHQGWIDAMQEELN